MIWFHITLVLPPQISTVSQQVEFFQLLLKTLPTVIITEPEDSEDNMLTYTWNGLIRDTFSKILRLYDSKPLDSKLQPAFLQIMGTHLLWAGFPHKMLNSHYRCCIILL